MKNFKIIIKLFWPHIVILLLLVAGILVSLVSFTNTRKQVEALYYESFVIKSAASTVNESFEAMQKSLFRAILNDSQDITNEAISDATNRAVIIQEQAALLRQNTFGDVDSFSKLEKDLSDLVQMQEYVLTLVDQNKNSKAAAYMENSMIPVIKEAQNELEHFILLAEKRGQELVASSRQSQKKAVILLISFGAASMLFSIGVGIFIWRYQKREKRDKQSTSNVIAR